MRLMYAAMMHLPIPAALFVHARQSMMYKLLKNVIFLLTSDIRESQKLSWIGS
jgi:hypothetical protein